MATSPDVSHFTPPQSDSQFCTPSGQPDAQSIRAKPAFTAIVAITTIEGERMVVATTEKYAD
jgi:hypothetical protein